MLIGLLASEMETTPAQLDGIREHRVAMAKLLEDPYQRTE